MKNLAMAVALLLAFAGVGPAGWSGVVGIPAGHQDERNSLQPGLAGIIPVTDGLRAYGVLSFAGEYRCKEAGVSYDINKNFSLDVGYRETKFDRFHFSGLSAGRPHPLCPAGVDPRDVEGKGWSISLIYKF